MSGATQSGVQDQVDQQSAGMDKLSARDLIVNRIVSGRLDNFEEESGIKLDRIDPRVADPDADPEDAATEAARKALEDGKVLTETDEEKAAREAKEQLAAQVAEPDLLKQKVKVKIDGVESEASIEDMQREYQKGRTADKRLSDLAKREQALEQRERELATPAAKAVLVDPVVDKASTKEFTSAMFEGDEEKAATAFEAAVAKAVAAQVAATGRGNATPEVDIDQITATIEQRFQVNSALEKSKAEYPEMYSDSDIEALGAMKIKSKRDEGMSFVEALESTGAELATKLGWKKSATPVAKTNPTTRDEKLANKEALDPVKGIGVKSTTTEAVPQTNSQVIAEMAKRRPGNGGG